jgi:hypothetical protein
VPCFDGLRVPARYATVAALALATLAGLGVAAIDSRRRRYVAIAASIAIVVEALAVPIPINQTDSTYSQANLAPLPDALALGASALPIYRDVAQLPADAIILELPVGEPAFDLRYMISSTEHWHRMVNGYSGFFPASYEPLTEAMKDVAARPDRAWQMVADSKATHVVIHAGAYRDDSGRRLGDWLRVHGAHEIASAGTDRLFAMPVTRTP